MRDSQTEKNRGSLLGLVLLGAVVILGVWMWIDGAFDMSPETRAWLESDRKLNAYVDTCDARHTQNLFPPLRSSRADVGGNCGLASHDNGVVCTINSDFIDEVQSLWEKAQTRNVCVVYERTRVTYANSIRTDPGVAVYAEDDLKHPAYLGLRKK